MNKVFLINKKVGWTSFDVVAKSKRLLHTKKVGHCGTLDPFAEGLLILCANKATKIIRFIELTNKTYIATLKLGIATSSGDTEGEVVETKDIPNLNKESISDVLSAFLGESYQLPPMYSALKKDGKRLYEYARENIEVEREKRKIEIFDINLLDYKNDEIVFEVTCSKGTYVRVLGEDIAKKLGTVGHLISLKRTRVGNYRLEDAIDVNDIAYNLGKDMIDAISFMPVVNVDELDAVNVKNGKDLFINKQDLYVAICYNEEVLAIYEKISENKYHCLRGLWGD